MGFFSKLRNWFTGKGFKETEKTKEEEIETPEPPKEEEIEVKEPKTKVTKKPETKEKQENEKPEEVTEKEHEENIKEIQRIQTDEQKVRKELTKTQKIFGGLKTINDINVETSENINTIYEHSTYYAGEVDGRNYAQHMKNAIMERQLRVDEQIAELIVANADKMKGRFTTTIEIYSQGSLVSEIQCAGELISDVHPILQEDSDLKEGTNISGSQDLFRISSEFIEKLHVRGINAKLIEKQKLMQGDAEIEQVRIKTNFN